MLYNTSFEIMAAGCSYNLQGFMALFAPRNSPTASPTALATSQPAPLVGSWVSDGTGPAHRLQVAREVMQVNDGL